MSSPYTTINEHELVLRLTQGDEQAFCELYARYKNRLIYFACAYLKSHDYAEDIFQDTFTAIWQSRQFINPNASFSTYLYTIVRNRILNQLRSLKTKDELKQLIFSQAIDADNTTEHELTTNELNRLLAAALAKLTPRQREIFEMSRQQQLSHKEIAKQLNISVNTVQEHISTSLHQLRTYLENHNITSADLVLILLFLSVK